MTIKSSEIWLPWPCLGSLQAEIPSDLSKFFQKIKKKTYICYTQLDKKRKIEGSLRGAIFLSKTHRLEFTIICASIYGCI